jgi:hypothetical protein
MRRMAVLLLLAGCSQDPLDDADQGEAAPPPAASAAAGNLAGDSAGLQARVDGAMAAALQDPAGARYRNVRPGLAGTVCGEVDPKRTRGGHAGFRPFLVTPQGVAMVAGSERLKFDDPADPFPDFYIRWCASPEELKRLEPELRRAIAGSGSAAPLDPLPGESGVPDPLLTDPGEPPPLSPPSGSGGKAETGPADVNSFINSVKRKRDQPTPGQ